MQDETKRNVKIAVLGALCFLLVGSSLVFGPQKICVVCSSEPVFANLNILSVSLTIIITGLFVLFLARSRWSPFSLLETDVWILNQIKKTSRKSDIQSRYMKKFDLSDRNFRKRISKLKGMKYLFEEGRDLKLTPEGEQRLDRENETLKEQ